MSEVVACCGTTCDKSKAVADQKRVVDAFDELDRCQSRLDYMSPDIDGLEKAFKELKVAISYLRETQ